MLVIFVYLLSVSVGEYLVVVVTFVLEPPAVQ